jgi:hypothetical protein
VQLRRLFFEEEGRGEREKKEKEKGRGFVADLPTCPAYLLACLCA